MRAISANKNLGILIMVAMLAISSAAQTQLRGTWTAEVSSKRPDKLQLNFFRSSERGQMGQSMEYSELKGLDPSAVQATNVPVKFQLVRDAGTVQLDGTFNKGLGHGEFNFAANQEYLSAMKQLGYAEVDRKAFELAVIDVSRAYAKEIRELGFDTSLDKLIEA